MRSFTIAPSHRSREARLIVTLNHNHSPPVTPGGFCADRYKMARRLTRRVFLAPLPWVRSNLTHGNENDLCMRLLLPRSGQQPGVGSRPRPRRQRRQAIDARRRSRPLRNLLESAPDVNEEGPRRGPSEAKPVGQALRPPPVHARRVLFMKEAANRGGLTFTT